MRGAQGTADAVAAAIVDGVVDQLAALAVEHGALPDGVIAEPALVTANPVPPEAVGIDDWPFVSVVPVRTPRYVRVEAGPDADTYVVLHELRALVWARSSDWAATAIARDRATQAVVQVLLAGEGALAGGDLVVERETVTVDWSPVGQDAELEAIVAAASITFTVGSSELLSRPIPGSRPDGAGGWDAEIAVTMVGDTQGMPGGAPPPGTF